MKIRIKLFLIFLALVIPAIVATNFWSLNKFSKIRKGELLERMNTQSFFLSRYLNTYEGDFSTILQSNALFMRSPFSISLVNMDSGEVYRNHSLKIDLSAYISQVIKNKIAVSKEVKTNHGDFLISVTVTGNKNGTALILISKMETVQILMKESYRFIGILILISLILTFIISYAVSRKLTKPIEKLIEGTKKFAEGDYDHKLNVQTSNEFGGLAKSFETMGQSITIRENRIREMNQELMLKEKLSTLGQFSAGVAHEIKNPLGAILANTQLAQRGIKKIDPEAKEMNYLQVVVDEVYRATHIIQDILSFSRQDTLSLETHSVHDFVVNVVARQEEVVKIKGHNFVLENGVNSLVEMDHDKLIQVVGNFIENAIGAMSSPGEIKLWTKEDDSSVSICVSDNGEGIPDNIKNKIFDPFFTTKSSKDGTGLGLSMCHGIVMGHGGEILVDSEVGKGSTFEIKLQK